VTEVTSSIRRLKTFVKAVAPRWLLRLVQSPYLAFAGRRYARLNSTSAVFDRIYEEKAWSHGKDEGSLSGEGSEGPWLDASVEAILTYPDLASRSIVEIGCGDFNFGSRIAPHTAFYTAIDVSPVIIEANRRTYAGLGNVEFRAVNGEVAALPQGQLVIIRQVLQHVTNGEIAAIMRSVLASNPEQVFVFEDVPADAFVPNRDLPVAGPFTRIGLSSGVDLRTAPFSLPFVLATEWRHPQYPQVRNALRCYILDR
jgi:SAM-dependent methyltransferase